jgi:hypothetical protein
MGFQSVAGMVITAASANGFPSRRFQWFGNETEADSNTTARFDGELLMGDFNANKVRGIAKVIAMRAQCSHLRKNFQFVTKTMLPAIMARGELHKVM